MGPILRLIAMYLTRFVSCILPKYTGKKRKLEYEIKPDAWYSHPFYCFNSTFLVLSIICFFVVICTIFFVEKTSDKIGCFALFGSFLLISMYFYLSMKNRAIYCFRETFDYYDMFTRKHTYKYSECTYKERKNSYKLYSNGKFACYIYGNQIKVLERMLKV